MGWTLRFSAVGAKLAVLLNWFSAKPAKHCGHLTFVPHLAQNTLPERIFAPHFLQNAMSPLPVELAVGTGCSLLEDRILVVGFGDGPFTNLQIR